MRDWYAGNLEKIDSKTGVVLFCHLREELASRRGLFGRFYSGKGAQKTILGPLQPRLLHNLGVNLLQPLPKTRLWDRLEQEGRLLATQTTGDSYGLGFNYLPSRPQEEILEEYVQAIDRLYEPSRYLERVYRYYLAMRPTRRLGSKDRPGPNPCG